MRNRKSPKAAPLDMAFFSLAQIAKVHTLMSAMEKAETNCLDLFPPYIV
jgi:hypothetical protein